MRKVLRGLAWVIGGLVAVVGVVYLVAQVNLARHADRHYEVAALAPPESGDLERGRHLAVTRGCTECHGADLGGAVAVDAGPVGRFVGPNLTAGGRGARYDAATFERALRHGVSAEGKPLLFMPSTDYAGLSDGDVAALYAYVHAQPSVARENAPSTVGPLGAVLFLFGKIPLYPAELIDHERLAPSAAPPAAVDATYGRYVAQTCTGCHGEGFSGGHVPGTPPDFKDAANLTPHETGLKNWTEADFLRAIDEGKRPDGSAIDKFMPWETFAKLDEVEKKALWAYLQTVPPKPRGNR
jgi:mono/diheme cytochrome c family protein